MNDQKTAIIIGSGPAGLTAGIYLARADIKTIIIEGTQPGGQLTTTTVVENFPGFAKGIDGVELMMNMRQQAVNQGCEIISDSVTRVDFKSRPLQIFGESKIYEADVVIVATGASSITLKLPNEEKYWAKGVHTCATCDGAFYKNQEIAVVGGGDAAMEEANFLSRFASRVYILNRSENFRASAIMMDRVKANSKVEILINTEVKEYLGESKLEAIKIINNQTQEEKDLKVGAVFMAIGHKPNTEFLQDQLPLDVKGFVVAKDFVLTELPNVFVAGDVADYKYRQAISSAGFGCMASLEAEKYLRKLVS